MPQDTDIVAARRDRLREWIDAHFGGKQSEFVRATGINQGELSGLLRSKSFREEKAINIEVKAKMPEGYLQRPTVPGSALKGVIRRTFEIADPARRFDMGVNSVHTHDSDQGTEVRYEALVAEIEAMQQVIGIMAVSLVQNVPDAVERVAESIRRNELGLQSGFLSELEQQIDRALAQRRESLGPPRGEATPKPGSARRRP